MRVSAIYTYPVKGCHRVTHDDAHVEPWGLAGDRRWMVVDADGVGVTQRDTSDLVFLRASVGPGTLTLSAPGLAPLTVPEPGPGAEVGVRTFRNRTATVPARPSADGGAWLSDLLDRPVRLVHLHDPTAQVAGGSAAVGTVSFADGYPLLVANAASLDALNDWLLESGDDPVPITRFRPNLVVSGAAPWAEDGWSGRTLRVGEAGAVLRGEGPCDRCVVTTIDQDTAEKGRQPLRALGQHRKREQGLLFGLNLLVESPGRIAVGDEVTLA